ncbi:MAG: ABC transporter permease, partial [Chlorobi bacterium]|nr:ABC transporter permease [Chlorobiota bacterium]
MSKRRFTYSWLELREILSIAWQSLLTHKTRSGLTMLGIIFGVAAVISMLSIGEGARQETLEQIEVMGMRNIIIRSKEASKENQEQSSIRPLGISMKDADALRQVCPFISAVSVSWESSMEARTYKGHSQVMVVGSQPQYADLFNVKMVVGKFFSKLHVTHGANVCVLGSEAKQKLFGFSNPIGKLVKLGDQWFTVLGVAAPKKIASTVSGITLRNYNLDIYVPLKTAMVKFPREQKATVRVFGRRGFFR